MSTAHTTLLLLIPAAYLAGSVPFGLIVGKAKGIDVRKSGSGNIGATNVGRLLGGKYFALVFALDLLKGLLPMLAAGMAIRLDAADGSMPAADPATTYLLWLAVGFAAIAGHLFSVFLKFTGGKGVATSAGVVLGLFPYFTLPALAALAVWSALFARTKIVSLASVAAALVFPVAYLALAIALGWQPFGQQWPLLAFSLLMAVMIVGRHKANIARLRAGTEHRFGRVKTAAAAADGPARVHADHHSSANGDGHGTGNGDGKPGDGSGLGRA